MHLSVQYFRPPFPESSHWEADLDRIATLGLDSIQLWITWGWVEPRPGEFEFDDYDRLFDAAAERGLGVIASTIAEVQPFWIHRVVPDSRMVNHLGADVQSGPRRENNAGVTPGGCWDNPVVKDHLLRFMRTCGEHFGHRDNLVMWDAWNETRWAVHADDYVCYCPHTVSRFHAWLDERHGGLEGVERAWKRRYAEWADVRPGLVPGRPYSETMDFERFLTWRAGDHMHDRAAAIRGADPRHDVTGHGVAPGAYFPGQQFEQALARGDDDDHVAHLDGYGLSMYPDFILRDPSEYPARANAVRSAAGAKPFWLSELEAAPTGVGFRTRGAVRGAQVRKWIWEGAAYGAAGAVLWQWYDELIGPEAAAFGLAGHDEHAAERLESVARTAQEMRDLDTRLGGYRPDDGEIVLLWDQGGYQLEWAERGAGADLVSGSVHGYARALERLGVPYRILATRHLDAARLAGARLAILPAPLIVAPAATDVLDAWIRAGGVLLTEPELDGWSETGIFRYPENRPFPIRLALPQGGRSPLDGDVEIAPYADRPSITIGGYGWIQPIAVGDRRLLASATRVDEGEVVILGTFAGRAYRDDDRPEFEQLLRLLLERSGSSPRISLTGSRALRLASGTTAQERLVFLVNDAGESVEGAFHDTEPERVWTEVLGPDTGQRVRPGPIRMEPWGVRLLVAPITV